MKNNEDTRAGSDIVAEVSDRIRNASNVLIALSKDPNIDELSAALGLSLILDKLNKRATAIFSGKIPNMIEFLQPEKTFEENTDSLQDFIVSLNAEKADHLRYKVEGDYVKVFFTPYRKETITEKDLQFSHGDFNVDLIISLNISEEAQLDDALREYGRIKHDASSVNISASAPGKFGDVEWGDPSASSICEMVVRLALDVQDPDEPVIDENVATTLLTGIIAATNRFSNERTSADTMSVASNLMISGANQQLIAKNIPVDILTKQPEPVKEEPKEEPKPEPKEEKKPEEEKKEPESKPQDPTNFSVDHKNKDKKPEAEPEQKSESKAEAPKEEPKPEAKEEPKEQPKEEPKEEAKPVAGPKPEVKPEAGPEPKPEPKAEAPKEEPKPEPKEEPKAEVASEKSATNDPKAETERIVAERLAKQEADKAAAEEKLRKEEAERKRREEEERAKNNAAKEEVMTKLIAERNEAMKDAGEGSAKHDLLQKDMLPPEPPKDYAKMISTELDKVGGPGYVPSSVDDTPTLTSEVGAPAAVATAPTAPISPNPTPVIKTEVNQNGILPPPPAPVGPSLMPPALPTINISTEPTAPAAPAATSTAPIVESAPVAPATKPVVETAPVVEAPKPEPVMPTVQMPNVAPAQPKPAATPASFASSTPAAMPGQTTPATPAPAPNPTPVTPASSNPQADPGAFHIPGM